MKKIYFLFYLVTLNNIYAQNIRFNKYFDLTRSQYSINSGIFDVLIQDSLTYFSGAIANNTPNGYSNPLIGCLNINGDTIWTKRSYTNLISCQAYPGTLTKVSNNKFLQVGMVWDSATFYGIKILHYPYLHMFDKNGSALLTKICNDSIDRMVLAATISNGYIYLSGISFSKSVRIYYSNGDPYELPDTAFAFLEKYDSLGNQIWFKQFVPKAPYYGGPVKYDFHNMISSNDGGVLISCYKWNPDTTNSEVAKPAIVKFDSNGNFKWIRQYQYKNCRNGNSNAWVCSGENDSVFYFASNCSTIFTPTNLPNTNSLLYYGKINSRGDTLWTRYFSPVFDSSLIYGSKYTEGRFIKYFNGKLYMLTWEYNGNPEAGFVIADTLGSIKAYRNLKKINSNSVVHGVNGLDVTNDRIVIGGYWYNQNIVPGIIDSLGDYRCYSWVIQTDTFGCWEENCQVGDSVFNLSIKKDIVCNKYNDLIVYPNPTTGMLQVADFKEGMLYVYNAMGQLIIQQTEPLIDLSKQANGIYQIRAYNTAQELIGIGRVVKE